MKSGRFLLALPAVVLVLISMGWLLHWWLYLANPYFEGDSLRLLTGALQTAKGFEDPLVYRYHNQPLYHLWLFSLARHLGPSLPWWTVVSSMFSFTLILGVSWDIARRTWKLPSTGATHLRLTIAGMLAVSMVLNHDLVISGCYPNSSIMAFASAALAIWVLVRWDLSWPAIFISALPAAAAPFLRNDAIFLAPALAFFFLERKAWRKGLAHFGALGLFALLLVWATGFDPSEALANAGAHQDGGSILLTPEEAILLSMPGVVLILALLGVIALVLARDLRPLLQGALVGGPFLLFYHGALTTPKYLIPLWIVLAWLAVKGWCLLRDLRPSAAWAARLACGISLLAQMVIPGVEDISTADGYRPYHDIQGFPARDAERAQGQSDRINTLIREVQSVVPARKLALWLGSPRALRFNLQLSMDALSSRSLHYQRVFQLPEGRECIVNSYNPASMDRYRDIALRLRAHGWVSAFEITRKTHQTLVSEGLPGLDLETRGSYLVLEPDSTAPFKPEGWDLNPTTVSQERLVERDGVLRLSAEPTKRLELCQDRWTRNPRDGFIVGEMGAEEITLPSRGRGAGVTVEIVQFDASGHRTIQTLAQVSSDQPLLPLRQRVSFEPGIVKARLCLAIKADSGTALFKGFRLVDDQEPETSD